MEQSAVVKSLFGPVGPMELVVIIGLIVLFFGASRLPQLGSGLGKGIKNFKDAISNKEEKALENGEEPPKN
jgi:sec-independent protein translocase protein TatA